MEEKTINKTDMAIEVLAIEKKHKVTAIVGLAAPVGVLFAYPLVDMLGAGFIAIMTALYCGIQIKKITQREKYLTTRYNIGRK